MSPRLSPDSSSGSTAGYSAQAGAVENATNTDGNGLGPWATTRPGRTLRKVTIK